MNFFAVEQNINTDSLAHLERMELIHEQEGSRRQSFCGKKKERENADYGLKKIN